MELTYVVGAALLACTSANLLAPPRDRYLVARVSGSVKSLETLVADAAVRHGRRAAEEKTAPNSKNRLLHSYENNLNIGVFSFSSNMAAELENDPDILAVEHDKVFYLKDGGYSDGDGGYYYYGGDCEFGEYEVIPDEAPFTSCPAAYQTDEYEEGQGWVGTMNWGLNRVFQEDLPLDPDVELDRLGLTGAGTTIYIIDDGVLAEHDEFKVSSNKFRSAEGVTFWGGRARDPATFPAGDQLCGGHGTHCAGIAAGKTYGVAPGAKVVPLRVFNCCGAGYNSDIIGAIDYAVADDTVNNKVISMSLGGECDKTSCKDASSVILNKAVDDASLAGVAVTVAAGNENENACKSSPASASHAFVIGSTTINDERSWFSDYGPCVDIFAPGSNILSAAPWTKDCAAFMDGTSMATPMASGMLSLVFEAQPTLTGLEAIELLKKHASMDKIDLPSAATRSDTPNKLLALPSLEDMQAFADCGRRPVVGSGSGSRCPYDGCGLKSTKVGRRWTYECVVDADATGAPTMAPVTAVEAQCDPEKNKKRCNRKDVCGWVGSSSWNRGGRCIDATLITAAPTVTFVCGVERVKKNCNRDETCTWVGAKTFSRGGQCVDTASITGTPTTSPTSFPTQAPISAIDAECTPERNRKKCNKKDICGWVGHTKYSRGGRCVDATTITDTPTTHPTAYPTRAPVTAAAVDAECTPEKNRKRCNKKDICAWVGHPKYSKGGRCVGDMS